MKSLFITADRFVPRVTVRSLLVAITFLGWPTACPRSESGRSGRGESVTNRIVLPYFVRGCEDSLWFEIHREACPVGWRIFGAEPLWIISLNGEEYSQCEALEVARLFPEAHLTRTTERHIESPVEFYQHPDESPASRLNALLAW